MTTTDLLINLTRQIARLTTYEDEFNARKNAEGFVEDDGVTYDDAEELLADLSDDRLMGEYYTLCELIAQAREIVDVIDRNERALNAAWLENRADLDAN